MNLLTPKSSFAPPDGEGSLQVLDFLIQRARAERQGKK